MLQRTGPMARSIRLLQNQATPLAMFGRRWVLHESILGVMHSRTVQCGRFRSNSRRCCPRLAKKRPASSTPWFGCKPPWTGGDTLLAYGNSSSKDSRYIKAYLPRFDGHGLAKPITLIVHAATFLKKLQLRLGLHSFGYHLYDNDLLMARMARTMASSLGAVVISRTNDWSIFTWSSGNRLR